MGKENFYYITVNGIKKELSNRLSKLYEESPCNTKSALMLYVIEKGLDAIDAQKEIDSGKEVAKLSSSLERIEERQKQLIVEIARLSKTIEENRIVQAQTRNVSVEIAKSIGVASETEMQIGKYDDLPGYLVEKIDLMENVYSNA